MENQIQPGLPIQPATTAGQGASQDQRAQAMQRQGIDPLTIRAILALQDEDQRAAESKRQRTAADQFRVNARNQLQGVDTGKFYVGPTWVNALASVMQQQAARREDDSAKARDEENSKRQREATERLFNALSRSGSAFPDTQ